MLVFEILNKILLTFMFENFPALFRYNYQIKIISISGVQCDSFIYIYTHTQTEKIITIKLINIPITSHSYCSFVCVVRPQRHISLVFFFFLIISLGALGLGCRMQALTCGVVIFL